MLSFAPTALSYVLPTLFVLTLIVTVHEFGHFIVARWFGVAVDEFSLGFGRAILKRRDRSGVEWRLGWIPLGGYVRFSGDENAASMPDGASLDELRRQIIAAEGVQAVGRYYHFKPIWQRAAIAAAGPAANFILAVILFAGLLMTVGTPTPPARVGQVTPGSPAAAAGFKSNDIVVQAAGTTVESFEALQKVIASRAGVATDFVIERNGGRLRLTATPKLGVLQDQVGLKRSGGLLGIYSGPTPGDLTPHRRDPLQALVGGVTMTWEMLDGTLETIWGIVTGQISPGVLQGVVGVAKVSHSVVVTGAAAGHGAGEKALDIAVGLLGLCGVVSVGIGFVNLLPIPVLDGGHLMFYAYEAIARRPLDAAVQALSYRVGLALLLGLMLFATTNDLQRGRVFHFLGGLFS